VSLVTRLRRLRTSGIHLLGQRGREALPFTACLDVEGTISV
jgi:hypothetical protein